MTGIPTWNSQLLAAMTVADEPPDRISMQELRELHHSDILDLIESDDFAVILDLIYAARDVLPATFVDSRDEGSVSIDNQKVGVLARLVSRFDFDERAR